jgi:Putative Actinobacterial Holin-X, holin superfamily III
MEATSTSFSNLFASLSSTFSNVFKNEVSLLQEEIGEKVSIASKGLIKIAIGAVLVLVALPALAAAIILALALIMPAWLASLIFALVFMIVGGILLSVGINSVRQVNLKPERTVSSVKDTLRAVREGWQTT